jgi:hypothetical protein
MMPAFVFPQDIKSPESTTGMERHGGMALRDYFAAQALNGMLANNEPVEVDGKFHEVLARAAYVCADAMLKAREGGK